MNNIRLQENLINNFKKEFKEKLGKGVKITICNRWQSDANFTNNVNFWAIVKLVFDYTGWDYRSTFLPGYSMKKGRPAGDNNEKAFRRSLIDFIVVNNGFTLVGTAKETGRRDHTSVINSISAFERRLETEYYTQKLFGEIMDYVRDNYHLYKASATLKQSVVEDNL